MAFTQITEEGSDQFYIINTDDIAVIEPKQRADWSSGSYVTMREGSSRYKGFNLDARQTELLKNFLASRS